MATSRQRNDRPGAPGPRPGHGSGGGGRAGHDGRRPPRGPAAPDGAGWLWGVHAVEAALANPQRELLRLIAVPDRVRGAEAALRRRPGPAPQVRVEPEDAGGVAHALPPGAVHGGVALLAVDLADPGLDSLAEPAHGVLLVLDQVTDPQNVGAVLRSAAAFGARGVVLQDRHSPHLAGALAKAAAGAVDCVPITRVVNLSRALERLDGLGWRTVGLAGEATADLAEVVADGAPVALVLGSEGEGLRRLVAEHCEMLARIPMPGGFDSLNVSAAAAVALYEATRRGAIPATGEQG